jgi:hypothetical protein
MRLARLDSPAIRRALACAIAGAASMLCACGGASELESMQALAPSGGSTPPSTTAPARPDAHGDGSWAAATQSASERVPPRAGADDAVALALATCGHEDAALDRVARELASHGERTLSRTSELLRRAGLAEVWPRVWRGSADRGAFDP